VIGIVREHTGSFAAPTALIAGMLLLAAVLVAGIRQMFFRRPATVRAA
jgi:hypothetical protein